MGFGANIWSEAGHGEGRLGDLGGGGGGGWARTEAEKLFLGLFWLTGRVQGSLGSQKTRGRGGGSLGLEQFGAWVGVGGGVTLLSPLRIEIPQKERGLFY